MNNHSSETMTTYTMDSEKILKIIDYISKNLGKVIAIEGNIGSGKSTLLSNLETQMGLNVIQEDVESWKKEGWLELFYSNLHRFSGTFQLRTQLSHIENKKKFREDLLNVIERSPISNKHIFGRMLMDDGYLHPKEYDIIGKVNEIAGWYPDIVVVLICDPEICFERIKKRGREGENIPSLDYLKALHQRHLALKDEIQQVPIVYLDTTHITPNDMVISFYEKIMSHI
jgi:deoxyadenosine/deoxycytidine kinase